MKKLIHIVILTLLFNNNSFSQIFENDICGFERNEFFKPWIGNNLFLENYYDSISIKQYDSLISTPLYYIPVTFWMYSDTSKSKLEYTEIQTFMKDLNYFNDLNNTGISYYLNEIIEINKSKHSEIGYYIEGTLISSFNIRRGTVNVHITNSLAAFKLFKPKIYYKGTYNKINKSIILIRKNSDTGLAHEVGHFFGLKHPHRNYDRGKLTQESVSRTREKLRFFRKVNNCEVSGDCLCDTPAEPQLSKYVNNNCEFTGTNLTDNWGDFYTPETENIMSYPTHKKCRDKFTEGQIAVMLYTAERSRFSNIWKNDTTNGQVSDFCFDKYEPDNYKEMATEIKSDEIQNHTFHKTFIDRFKNNADNDVDWFLYKLQNDSTNSFNISISNGEYNFSEIDIHVFNNEDILIFEKKCIKDDELIKVEKLSDNEFYILISKSKKNEKNIKSEEITISDYLIKIEELP